MNPSLPGASLAVFSLPLLRAAREAAPVLRQGLAKGWIWFTAAGLDGAEFQRKKQNAKKRACMARWRARRRAERGAGLRKPAACVLAEFEVRSP